MALPTLRRVSPARVAAVTGGLALAGAVAGAVVADLVLAGGILITDGPAAVLRQWRWYGFGALAGGVCGVVLGPLAAWLFLRRVPLGRAVLETSIGSAVGTAVGLLLGPTIATVLGGALVGLLASALRLRWQFRPTTPER
jgi:hypothetical protein